MLEWHFEHFKTFYTYEIIQQAAVSLILFEGENTDASKNARMLQLTKLLVENTGHPAWMPARDTGNLEIDNEGGSVFRNKARLLSTFYLCVPPSFLEENGLKKEIVMTNFGKALALGYVSEKEFYDFMIKKFQYPHPAFDNYKEWLESGLVIRPFIFILKTLVKLLESGGYQNAYLTVDEICNFLVPLSSEDEALAASKILENRLNPQPITSAQDKRKIREMLAFLAMSEYVYIDSTDSRQEKYFLNLIDRHSYEKTYYFHTRSAGGAGTGQKKYKESKLEKIIKLWEE
ncbi:hypothetical protein [Brevibacillus borstelensis]|uniref:hypothetical protein n=1 Tax=Brevibacillus borstelensis TaxID=45462 RepID=UPI002E24ABF7|nr:hypothetical protein [Brevibacillus borstelensis]